MGLQCDAAQSSYNQHLKHLNAHIRPVQFNSVDGGLCGISHSFLLCSTDATKAQGPVVRNPPASFPQPLLHLCALVPSQQAPPHPLLTWTCSQCIHPSVALNLCSPNSRVIHPNSCWKASCSLPACSLRATTPHKFFLIFRANRKDWVEKQNNPSPPHSSQRGSALVTSLSFDDCDKVLLQAWEGIYFLNEQIMSTDGDRWPFQIKERVKSLETVADEIKA